MSQTTESSNELVYSATRCHDDSSDDSDGYTIVRNSNESSTEDEDDDSVEYDTGEDEEEQSFSYASKDDLEEEDRVDEEKDEAGEEQDTGYLDFLIEAYDSLLSRYNSKQAVALASRIAVRRIYQGSLIQEAVKLVGKDAVRKLAIIGSLQGTNTKKINKTISVTCSGEAVKGDKTIQQLVQSSIISQKGSKYDSSNKKIHINLLAAAMPHAAFQYMMKDAQDTDIARKKSRHSIDTTLPLQLQYLEAGSLPLGTKTRKAHLHWSSQFLKSINCKFNPTIYKRGMKQAVVYESMEWLTKELDDIEGSLTLNSKEKDIDFKQFFKKYYAIAQKARANTDKQQHEGNCKKTTKAERRRRRNATKAN